MDESLTIGQVATRSRVPAKTIRYYEQIGLLPEPARGGNGYRRYTDRSVETLRFVKRARDLGFSVEEVQDLLTLWQDAHRTSAEVKALAEAHIRQVEEKIVALEGLRGTLRTLVAQCHGDHRPDCPILDDLAAGPPNGSGNGLESPEKV